MDIILWILTTISQVVVGVVGFVLTLRPSLAEQHFKALLITFALATLLAIVTSLWSFIRSQNSSSAVALLTEQILYEVKGSPEATLDLSPNFTKSQGGKYEEGIFVVAYYNDSKYPMMDTDIWIDGTMNIDEANQYHRKIGDIYPGRGGHLPKLALKLKSKDKICYVQFGIRSRSSVMWQKLYFFWNGKGWVSDSTAFKEVDCKTVYFRELRPDSPFAKDYAFDKQQSQQASDAQEAFEREQAAKRQGAK